MLSAALLLLFACDDGKTPADDSSPVVDPATVTLHGPCPLDLDYGGFTLTIGQESSNIDGAVADGVVPFAVLEQLMAEGDCVVLRRNNPFCDPACDRSQTCDFDGQCVDYPANQDLGTVSMVGLARDAEMTPVFPGNTYFDTSLPHPAVQPGALVTLGMPGGVYGPATLYGVGVEALDLAPSWTLESGVDLEILWPAPTASPTRSEVAIELSIDQHGVTPSVLRCVFADDGAGTVPGAVVATLVDVGVTGFPAGSIERRTVDSAPAGPGCMDLTVRSPRVASVDVVGHTPCVTSNECPEGQHCNEELQTCE